MEASRSTSVKYNLTNTWEIPTLPRSAKIAERELAIGNASRQSDTPDFSPELCQEIIPMPFHEELIVIILWATMFTMLLLEPVVLLILLVFRLRAGITLIVIKVALSKVHVPFTPSFCHSYIATLCLKYFSYRTIWNNLDPLDRSICCMPPHGLFPFGGLLSMFAMPRSIGTYGRGATASFLLGFPIMGQLLQAIGCVDASRQSLESYISKGYPIGVSSGGIAEMFEINASEGTEVIILKSRGGICKLALRTGTDIVPGYLFGSTKSYSVLYDQFGILQWLSRKLQTPFLFFYGRYFLPIPYRKPLLSVFGERIHVEKIENPSQEDIDKLLVKLQDGITTVFDKYKTSFGWKNVKLVIK